MKRKTFLVSIACVFIYSLANCQSPPLSESTHGEVNCLFVNCSIDCPAECSAFCSCFLGFCDCNCRCGFLSLSNTINESQQKNFKEFLILLKSLKSKESKAVLSSSSSVLKYAGKSKSTKKPSTNFKKSVSTNYKKSVEKYKKAIETLPSGERKRIDEFFKAKEKNI